MRLLSRLFLLLLAAAPLLAGTFNQASNRPFPPHRVVGNIYFVGTNALGSFLITTEQGHILINPDYEQSVPLIQASVEKLGFKMRDIRIILISHAHDDHVAGAARMKQLTGARVMVMQQDVAEMEDGGESDFNYSDQRWTPVKVDRVLHDGDEVRLGSTVLKAHLTPGHTKGCTTWTLTATEKGRGYKVVIVGSPNVNPGYRLVNNAKYPEIAADYERGLAVLKALPCDVFLGAHGGYYDLDKKYAKLQAGDKDAFVDPAGYRDFVADREQAFHRELRRQAAAR